MSALIKKLQPSDVRLILAASVCVVFLFVSPTTPDGGAGVEASFPVLQHMGDTMTKFETKPAYRFLAGTEIALISLRRIFEYQMTMVSDPNVDPDFWGHYFLYGLRF